MGFNSSTLAIIFLLVLSAFLVWRIYRLQNNQDPTASKTNGNYNNDHEIIDQNKFTEILNRITDGFVSLDNQWNYTFVNQKACELLNKTAEELIGKNIWDLFPDGVGLPFYHAYHKALESQKQVFLEEHYAPSNTWFENYIYPSKDGLSIFFRNTSEKKQSEQLIFNEKNLSDSIINSLPGLFYIADINGKLIRWNKLFESVSGYTKDEITTMRVIDFVDIDQRQEVLSKKTTTIQSGETEIESFLITKDKQKIPYFFTSNYSKYKEAPCLLGVGIDISKLKEAERQREIEQTNKEALINTTKEMMWSVDRNLKIIAANNQFLKRIEEITGVVKKYGDSVIIDGFFTQDQLEYWKKLYGRAFSGESFVEEFYTPSLEHINKAWSEASLNPIYKNQEIIGVACLVRNTSETKFYENELIKINQQLSTAQKIANLGYWEYIIKTKTTYWSDQTYAIFELDKNESINFRKFFEIVHPDDKSKVLSHKEKLMLGDKVENLEHRIVLPNGQIKIILETITVVTDENNVITKIEGTSQDITNARNIEEQIIQSNERFDLISSATTDVIWDWNLKNNSVWWNDNFYNFLGLEKETTKMDLDVFFKSMNPDDLKRVSQKIQNTFDKKEIFWTDEYRLIKSDGTINYFLDRASIIYDETGNPLRMVGAMLDLTQIKQAEELIINNEKRFRALIENSSDGLTVVTAEGLITDISPSGKKILGYHQTETINHLQNEHIHPNDINIVRDAYEESIKSLNSTKTFEYRHKMPNGNYKWLEMTINNMLDKSYVNAIVLNYKEISERKESEKTIKLSEEKYRTFFENSIDGILLTNPEGNVLAANPAACEILNRTEKEIIQEGRSGLTDIKEKANLNLWDNILNSGKVRGELYLIKKDGTRFPAEISSATFRISNNELRNTIIFRDVTERKKAESELNKLNHELLLLNQANSFFLHAENEIELLETICNLLTEKGKYSMAWIGFMPTENSINRKIIPNISAGNNLEYLKGLEIDLDDSVLSAGPTGQTMITGKAHFVNHISNDPTFCSWKSQAIKYNFKSSASFPIVIENNTIASLNIYSSVDSAFDQHETEILSRLVNNLSFAIKALRIKKAKAETEKALQLSNSQFRQLSSHLQSIREEERTSIAREIHDVLGQQMTAFKYDLAWLGKKKTFDDSQVLEKIQAMNKSVDETIQSIRKISSELRPRILDDLGLNAAMEWFISSFEKNTGIKCTLNSTLEGLKIEKIKSITIYRILQEALTNVARHSKASSVQINATIINDEIYLEIQDNGIGITEITQRNINSLGLLGMNERANMIKGVLVINGLNNKGTSVVLKVPVESMQSIN